MDILDTARWVFGVSEFIPAQVAGAGQCSAGRCPVSGDMNITVNGAVTWLVWLHHTLSCVLAVESFPAAMKQPRGGVVLLSYTSLNNLDKLDMVDTLDKVNTGHTTGATTTTTTSSSSTATKRLTLKSLFTKLLSWARRGRKPRLLETERITRERRSRPRGPRTVRTQDISAPRPLARTVSRVSVGGSEAAEAEIDRFHRDFILPLETGWRLEAGAEAGHCEDHKSELSSTSGFDSGHFSSSSLSSDSECRDSITSAPSSPSPPSPGPAAGGSVTVTPGPGQTVCRYGVINHVSTSGPSSAAAGGLKNWFQTALHYIHYGASVRPSHYQPPDHHTHVQARTLLTLLHQHRHRQRAVSQLPLTRDT